MNYDSCTKCKRLISEGLDDVNPYANFYAMDIRTLSSRIDGQLYCGDCAEAIKAERGVVAGKSIVVHRPQFIEESAPNRGSWFSRMFSWAG